MKIVEYTDSSGLKTKRLVPDGALRTTYNMGVVLGPPSLDSLGLSRTQNKALNHALVNADMVMYQSMSGRRAELLYLIKDTLKCSKVQAKEIRSKLLSLYQQQEYPESFE